MKKEKSDQVPVDYASNTKFLLDSASHGETTRYLHTSGQSTQHKGFLRLSFDNLDTDKCTVRVCEAVLVRSMELCSGGGFVSDTVHGDTKPKSSLQNSKASQMLTRASRISDMDDSTVRNSNIKCSFDHIGQHNVKANRQEGSFLYLRKQRCKYSSSLPHMPNATRLIQSDFPKLLNADDGVHSHSEDIKEIGAKYNRRFHVVVFLSNSSRIEGSNTAHTNVIPMLPVEYLRQIPEQFAGEFMNNGPVRLIKSIIAEEARNVSSRAAGTNVMSSGISGSDYNIERSCSGLNGVYDSWLGIEIEDRNMNKKVDETNWEDEGHILSSAKPLNVQIEEVKKAKISATPPTGPIHEGYQNGLVVLNPVWEEHINLEIKYDEAACKHEDSQISTEQRPSPRYSMNSNITTLNAKQSSLPEGVFITMGGESAMADPLDRMLTDVTKIVLVVMEDTKAVGEVVIPLRKITTRQDWFALHPVSPIHIDGLTKSLMTERHLPQYTIDPNDMEDRAYKHRSLNRKLFSVRTAIMSITFLELLLVTALTTSLVYKATMSEMQKAVESLSGQIWVSIEIALKQEFVMPFVETSVLSTFFNIPGINHNNSAEPITSYLFRSLQDLLGTNYSLPSSIFVGFSQGEVYTAGLGYNEDRFGLNLVVSMVDYTVNINNTQLSNGTGYVTYGSDLTCAHREVMFGCTVYNQSDVQGVVPLDIQLRPWFTSASNSLGVVWSDVYVFIGGSLGVTASLRVPQSLDKPVKAVIGSDTRLNQLSKILQGISYYKTGYAILFESVNGSLLASSEEINLTAQFNCSGLDSPVVERVRLYSSTNELFQYLNDYLIDQCIVSGVCFIRAPTKENMINDCFSPESCQESGSRCQPLPSVYRNNTVQTAKDAYATQSGPLVSVMPNGDTLSIGFLTHTASDIVVAVVIPNEDYAEYFDTILRITVGAGVVIMIASMIVAAILAHIVSRKLEKCTKNLSQFANLDFSTPVDSEGLNSPIKEIACVYTVLARMRVSLRSFSKYVPAGVVRLLVESGLEASLGGESRVITCFCTDIVDFTCLSESLDIDRLCSILDDYLLCMSEIIHEQRGTVDKYIGDSIVVMWNAPEIVVDHAHRACEAALLCQARLAVLRDEWVSKGLPPLHQRVGIHTGLAIVGNVGSMTRLNYTAIGNNVDFTNKLEAANKTYGTDILISDVTHAMVRDSFVTRPVDDIMLPGLHPRTCRLYELVAHIDTATEGQVVRCKRFEKAYTTFHDDRDPHGALRFLEEYRDYHLHTNDEDDIFDPNYDTLLEACRREVRERKVRPVGIRRLQRSRKKCKTS
eukprot:CFRG0459T1